MRVFIKTIPVDILQYREVIDKIENYINQNTPHHIITLNSLMYYYAINNKLLKEIILKSDLVLPDSIGIVLAIFFTILRNYRISKKIYEIGFFDLIKKISRITGIDLMLKLCEISQKKYNIFLLGAKPEIIGQTVLNLKKLFPEIIIKGFYHGYFSKSEEKDIINLINRSNIDILFVGMNVPKQEEWIYNNLKNLNSKVVIGVGGSFDIISKKLKRAPLFLQNIGLEWLYRVIQQPFRIKRIKDLPKFIYYIIK